MRIGYKFAAVRHKDDLNLDLNLERELSEKKLEYGLSKGFASAEDFLKTHCSERWKQELSSALKTMLSRNDRILSIGSGLGEHEIALHLNGYRVIASDVVPYGIERTAKLFPNLEIMTFDILNPVYSCTYDCILITGLLFYFNNSEAANIFNNCNSLLKPSGKLIFVLRYRDNIFTRFVDNFLLPWEARIKNMIFALKRRKEKFLRKKGGYRRKIVEILKFANIAGFELQEITYAGYGIEAARSGILRRIPFLFNILLIIDRKIHMMNNATIFSFRKVRELG